MYIQDQDAKKHDEDYKLRTTDEENIVLLTLRTWKSLRLKWIDPKKEQVRPNSSKCYIQNYKQMIIYWTRTGP